jgi:hypothetical protein
MPVIVLAVDVNDRRRRKLFGRDVFKASQVNAVNSINVGSVTNAKRTHAAVFAEIVLVALGVEQVFGELRLTGKKAKRFRFYYRRPKSVS